MSYESFHLWKKVVGRASGEGEPERSGGEPSPEGPPAEGPQAREGLDSEEGNPSAESDTSDGSDLQVEAAPPAVPPVEKEASPDPADKGDSSEALGLAIDLPPTGRIISRRGRPRRGYKLPPKPQLPLSPSQKILLLDTWKRSGLPARDFGALVGVSPQTLYAWKRAFERDGPAGLMPKSKGPRRGSRISEITKRAILMMKEANPEWGCQRISDMLVRGPALAASPNAVARVLREAGYEAHSEPTRPHPDKVRRFERASPNQLWQTDLFTFVLKRQNRRVHLVAFMDDHSRFITAFGLHASQSAALVIEVLRQGFSSYGAPEEILTDNGAQYVTWRGKSQFSKELQRRGIKHIVAKPRRPQTLGKIERFWGTLWRECIEAAVFLDLEDARRRIGLFIDHYNLQRPHQGIRGLTPADCYFEAAPQVLKTLKERLATNAAELARHGVPKKPFYLTGVADGQPFSVHREGDRVVLRRAGASREEVELAAPPTGDPDANEPGDESLPDPLCPDGSPSTAWSQPDEALPVGVSPLDEDIAQLQRALDPSDELEDESAKDSKQADDEVDSPSQEPAEGGDDE